ncbi:MAG: DnaJ domain-containing protein [Holophagaceae bacterium]|nr:DnaJ domain-containing protein [Holophagaceae bacterium]
MNPFDILEIRVGASADEIKASYHRLAKMWHPDRFTGPQKEEAESRFRDISEAFNVLKDPERRGWAEEEFKNAHSGSSPQASQPGNTNPGLNPLERTPDDWYQEALKAFQNLDTERALGLVQFAIRQDPNQADYHLFQAKVLETKGSDRRSIIKCFEAALNLQPKNVETMLRLAEHFQALGMQARATALIQRAREISPNHKMLKRMGVASGPSHEEKGKSMDIKGLGDLGQQAKTLFNKILRRG